MILIDGEKQNEKEIADRFKVKFRKSAIFNLNPLYTPADELNGGKKIPRAQRLQPSFIFNDTRAGSDVEFRYTVAINKKPGERRGEFTEEYATKRVEFRGDKEIVTSLDKFLFFVLHPQCEQSPFHRPELPVLYSLENKFQEAQETIKEMNYFTKVLEFINALSGADLRIKARGYGLHVTDDLSDAEVKSALYIKAKEDPKDVLDKLGNASVEFYGMVKTCLDKQLIRKRLEPDPALFYNAGDRKNRLICNFDRYEPEPELILSDHLSMHLTEHGEYMRKLLMDHYVKENLTNAKENAPKKESKYPLKKDTPIPAVQEEDNDEPTDFEKDFAENKVNRLLAGEE
jgi:hypothetical protein